MNNIGTVIKQQRVMSGLTLRQLGEMSGVSWSHLARIEKRNRFPSAKNLRKIAQPLGFDETELFVLADYLPPHAPTAVEGETRQNLGRLDPYVASVLASESVAIQHTVIGILTILKSIAKTKYATTP